MSVPNIGLDRVLPEGVRAEPYGQGRGLPLFLHPVDRGLAEQHQHFLDWFRSQRSAIDDLIARAGAIVLRGFAVHTTAEFSAVMADFPSLGMGYAGGATPRQALAEKVFESTRLPAAHKLPLHQEMAYLPHFPSKLAFFCRVAATTGGETIIGDMRRFGAKVPRPFWDAVKARGVRYERNYRAPGWSSGNAILDSYHRPWTEALGVDSADAAETKCREMGLEPQWEDNGSLTMRFCNAGMITHPQTGELLWFNQIAPQSFIRECIGAERFDLYEQYYGPNTPLPVRTSFGDGGAIDPADVAALLPLLDDETVAFPWRHGDLMFLDNFNVAHGRNPFTGERDTQVALIA